MKAQRLRVRLCGSMAESVPPRQPRWTGGEAALYDSFRSTDGCCLVYTHTIEKRLLGIGCGMP